MTLGAVETTTHVERISFFLTIYIQYVDGSCMNGTGSRCDCMNIIR